MFRQVDLTEYDILDISGRSLVSGILENTGPQQIQTEGLPAGLYLFRARGSEISRKITFVIH